MDTERQVTTDPNDPFAMLTEMREKLVFPADVGQGSTFGITKRELFAAMAMQGICGDGIPGSHHRPTETARDAVAQADALLKELAK